MCHQSVLSFFAGPVLTVQDVEGKDVLEVGSYDVNGSVRPLIEAYQPASYIGVDNQSGPRVDKVLNCTDLLDVFGPDVADIVVSTEMLEHVEDWQECLRNLFGVVRPDGLLIVTTRSRGFPYHPFPGDYWRYSIAAFRQILDAVGFEEQLLVPDPQAPGIFCKARKPQGWTWPDRRTAEVFAGIPVTAVLS